MDLETIDLSGIRYSNDTGQFYWTSAKSPRLAGRRIGTPDKDGYLTAKVSQVRVRLHRLAWRMHYGAWPEVQVDHINGVKTDNRISNLRLATNSENNCNRGPQANNKLGIRGVRKHGKRFQALICKDKKQMFLGSYETAELAAAAYRAAAKQLHGDFAHAN